MAVRERSGQRSKADGVVAAKAGGISLTRECSSAGLESDEKLQVSERWWYKI